MKYTGLTLAAILVLATSGDGTDRAGRPPLSSSAPQVSLGANLPEPPNAPVRVGDRAPDFSWSGSDGRPHRLREALDQAHVLLVFAADDEVLRSLENERASLAELGVVPMAVLEGRAGSLSARARRLGVHCIVVPDLRHVIGSQFDVIDPTTDRSRPAWFAVDRRGVVRGEWHEGLPTQGWTRIAASALAIPLRDSSLPAQSR
jgi:peroxiredoxin